MELMVPGDDNMYLQIFTRDFLIKLCYSFENIIASS